MALVRVGVGRLTGTGTDHLHAPLRLEDDLDHRRTASMSSCVQELGQHRLVSAHRSRRPSTLGSPRHLFRRLTVRRYRAERVPRRAGRDNGHREPGRHRTLERRRAQRLRRARGSQGAPLQLPSGELPLDEVAPGRARDNEGADCPAGLDRPGAKVGGRMVPWADPGSGSRASRQEDAGRGDDELDDARHVIPDSVGGLGRLERSCSGARGGVVAGKRAGGVRGGTFRRCPRTLRQRRRGQRRLVDLGGRWCLPLG